MGERAMISEPFINICFELIFSRKKRELDISVYEDINCCLCQFQLENNNKEIPLLIESKFSLLKKICEVVSGGGDIAQVLTSLVVSQNFSQHGDFIFFTMEKTLDENTERKYLQIIQDMMTWGKVNKTYKEFEKYQDKVQSGNVELIQEAINDWSALVKSAFNDVTDYEMKTKLGLVRSLSVPADDLAPIVKEVKKKYSKENVIPSGVRDLDENFLHGGFQPSRVYMFGGISGVGKSILLLNLAVRGAMSFPHLNPINSFGAPGFDGGDPKRCFLYITLENYVYETWTRLYCALTKKTKKEMLKVLNDPSSNPLLIKQEIDKMLSPYNSSIQIEYFPSNTISPMTIAGLINKYNRDPEKRIVKAVYLDYLDLLSPDEKREFYRLELGQITSRLKMIAASSEIPIITATQLNREAYKKSGNSDPGIETVSESIQKIFNADFGAILLRNGKNDENTEKDDKAKPLKVNLKIEKNRDGKTGKTHFYFNYPQSRFLTKDEYEKEHSDIMEI